MWIPLLRAAVVLGLPLKALAAQTDSALKLGLTPRWRAEQFLPSQATIELALSRAGHRNQGGPVPRRTSDWPSGNDCCRPTENTSSSSPPKPCGGF